MTIPADGAARTVRISSATAAPTLSLRAVPVLDPTAYLEAVFVNEEDAALVPGEVTIHRDGASIGRTMLALVAPGDEVILAFGADDRVKVARVPVTWQERESGFLATRRANLAAFKTVVKNLHDFPVRITVVDRVPVAETTEITVETLPPTAPATEKVDDDKPGVMVWTYDYPPGEQKKIRLACRLKWPADRRIVVGEGASRTP